MTNMEDNWVVNLTVFDNTTWNSTVWNNWFKRQKQMTYDPGEYVPDECYPLLDLLDFFHLYYIPVIILIGLVGNLLSCVVFLNTHLKMRSSSYYLAALATADFGFLATLLMVWLNNNIGVQVFNKDGWCQGLVYVSSVCSFLSVWLIVAFTVERFIAVQYPLHRPHMCTVARAKAIVLCLTVVALLTHCYSFVTAGMVRVQGGMEVCDMREGYHEAMRIINIIDSLLTLIVPLALIIVMNTMITRNLIRFSRRFKHQGVETINDRSDMNLNQIHSSSSTNRRPNSQQSFHSSNTSRHQHSSASQGPQPAPAQTTGTRLTTNNMSTTRHQPSVVSQQQQPTPTIRLSNNNLNADQLAPSRCIHVRSSSRNLVSTRTQQSITKMLLLISTVFVLLNLPSYVIRLYVFVFFSLWRQTTPASLWCMQQFFMLLYYTNFSINFLLYSMCGITFRRCLWQLIRNKLKALTRYHCNMQSYR